MIRIILMFLLLLTSVGLGVYIKDDPGYLLIAIHHWSIETTLSIAIIGLIILFVTFHILLLLLNWVRHLPNSWRQKVQKQRIQHAQATTQRGLIEFSEGYWLDARNNLIKAVPDTDTPLLNYLTAARAAQEMGDNKRRDNYLREAQQVMPEATIAVELTQAQLQLANQQWEQALATLRHLQDVAPQHPYVLKLLMRLYEEVNDWPQLISLLPQLKNNKVITEDAYHRLQQQAYLKAMLDLIKQNQGDILVNFIASLPKQLINDPEIVEAYSRYLLSRDDHITAEALLRRCLSKQYNDQLIMIYGQINGNNRQLTFAESLLKTEPRSPSLLLCLGSLCKARNLWGKAKLYFEQSIEFGPTPTAYMALGNLLEQLNDHAGACNAYQCGLLLTIKPI